MGKVIQLRGADRPAGLLAARQRAGRTRSQFAIDLSHELGVEIAAGTLRVYEEGRPAPPELVAAAMRIAERSASRAAETEAGAIRLEVVSGLHGMPRDYDAWTDDLERAAECLGKQQFGRAITLLNRWLVHDEADGEGMHLRARSLMLFGDAQRDQGNLVGPRSAQSSYRQALEVFRHLGVGRRMAQAELSLTVIAEMTGDLDGAVRRYGAHAFDGRLSPRDRARANLWIGTALSKHDEHAYAVEAMTRAVHEFESLDEPDDWSVAHQKLALAHRGIGDLDQALRHIDLALRGRRDASPLQRVRLDTAHAHVLLSNDATMQAGLALLDRSSRLATRYALSHQRRSIESIRTQFTTQ